MTNESVLFALNDIDGEFLEEARNTTPSHRIRRTVILVAALISLLIATACAAEEITGWLGSFFAGRAESDLSAGQIGYIEEHEQLVSDSQEQNGWTVELKSYLATDDTVYVIFGITAPKNVDIAELEKRILLDDEFTDIYGRSPGSVMVRHLDDGDGQNNTIEYVCVVEHAHYGYYSVPDSVTEWNIHIGSIFTVEYDETAHLTEYPVLVEGDWNFTIDLTKADTETVELVSAPFQTLAIIPNEETSTLDYVTVTSVRVSPLDAFITYEPSSDYFVSFVGFLEYTNIELHAYVVMKDGSSIPLLGGHPSYHGKTKLLTESPIVLDEVDHVLLADGTKLTVP